VDDGELLVYPSNLWLPGGFTMLQLSSRWPLFDLWSCMKLVIRGPGKPM
jgi:hypothetical protein